MKRLTGIWITALLVLLGAVPGVSLADNLRPPSGEVVLTVQGQIANTNDGASATFDMAMLESLPHHSIKTENPWEDGMTTYQGVLLRDLWAAVGARGAVMTLFALDDYHNDISSRDVQSIDVMLAYKREGAYMPIRNKGPLFVVFPFTDDPSLLTAARKDQSVWQVNRIGVR